MYDQCIAGAHGHDLKHRMATSIDSTHIDGLNRQMVTLHEWQLLVRNQSPGITPKQPSNPF